MPHVKICIKNLEKNLFYVAPCFRQKIEFRRIRSPVNQTQVCSITFQTIFPPKRGLKGKRFIVHFCSTFFARDNFPLDRSYRVESTARYNTHYKFSMVPSTDRGRRMKKVPSENASTELQPLYFSFSSINNFASTAPVNRISQARETIASFARKIIWIQRRVFERSGASGFLSPSRSVAGAREH